MTVHVTAGATNVAQDVGVADVYRMPDYIDKLGANDLALLRLSGDVVGVEPYGLAVRPAAIGRHAAQFGFGETRPGEGDAHEFPRFAEEYVLDPNHLPAPPRSCLSEKEINELAALRKKYPRAMATQRNTMYTGVIRGGGAKGDSGGPVLVRTPSGIVIAGIFEASGDLLCHSSADPQRRPRAYRGYQARVDGQSDGYLWISSTVQTASGGFASDAPGRGSSAGVPSVSVALPCWWVALRSHYRAGGGYRATKLMLLSSRSVMVSASMRQGRYVVFAATAFGFRKRLSAVRRVLTGVNS